MTARKGNIYTGFIRSALRIYKKIWLSKITAKLGVCFPFKACKFVCWQLLLRRTVQMTPQGNEKEMILDSYLHCCAIDSFTNSTKVVFNY